MSERKNINKLFQENFENFEVIPDEIVWKNIEMKLNEKKKRRVVPFWWKLSGIAATLLIGFFIFIDNSKPRIINTNSVAKQEKDSINKSGKIEPKIAEEKENVTTVNNEIKTDSNKKEIVNVSNISNQTNSVLKEKTVIGNENSKNNHIINSTNKSLKNKSDKVNALSIVKNKSEEKIAFHATKQKKIKNSKPVIAPENNNSLAEKSVNAVEKTTDSNNNSNKVSNSTIANNNTINQNKSVVTPNIKSDEIINKKIDSIKIASVEPNALEELLKEKESKSITEPKLNRWQVSTNIAPIYFSSITNGSPLDDKLANNDKTYSANNQSYGLGLNYAINKKLKIRTGINVLNMDYNTNGIVYYQTQSVTGKLTNLNPNTAGNLIVIENLSNVNSPFNKIADRTEGSLNQKLGYIEMPLELSYKVLNKKFGIDVIGGMSTMVLNKNEIYLQSTDLNLKIGEANNLNSIHFSGNLGVGFKYDIFKHLEARIEPVFKYQLNTFSNDSGNFKPYVFGVYSGINFSF